MCAHNTKVDAASLEENLEALEALVKTMESDETSLDDSLEAYGQGVDILARCEKQLKHAELKLEQIREVSGKLELEPFDI